MYVASQVFRISGRLFIFSSKNEVFSREQEKESNWCENGIEKLVMPICDPQGGFFYPTLTLIIDSYTREAS